MENFSSKVTIIGIVLNLLTYILGLLLFAGFFYITIGFSAGLIFYILDGCASASASTTLICKYYEGLILLIVAITVVIESFWLYLTVKASSAFNFKNYCYLLLTIFLFYSLFYINFISLILGKVYKCGKICQFYTCLIDFVVKIGLIAMSFRFMDKHDKKI